MSFHISQFDYFLFARDIRNLSMTLDQYLRSKVSPIIGGKKGRNVVTECDMILAIFLDF